MCHENQHTNKNTLHVREFGMNKKRKKRKDVQIRILFFLLLLRQIVIKTKYIS